MMIKEKNPVKFRHELKHIINAADDRIVTGRLQKLLPRDQHAGSHGTYRVSSLYFDNPFDKALLEKINGTDCREKFRIRYYDSDFSFIRLEKKIKKGGLCAKYSAMLSSEQTEKILKGDTDFLLKSDDPLLSELYSKMKGQLLAPKTIVRYTREAFFYGPGNARVTVDRNLQTSLSCTDFLNDNLFFADVSDDLSVLEIKYDEFLPDIVKIAVQLSCRRAGAFSKYAACRRYD